MSNPVVISRPGFGAVLGRWWWLALIAVPVMVLAGLIVGAVIAYVTPKKFESSAVIQYQPAKVTTLIPEATMKGDEVLAAVDEKLDLTGRWGLPKQEVLARLRQDVRVDNIRGTGLYTIRALDTDRAGARDIAQQVAESFKDFARQEELRSADKAIHELETMVREQEDKEDEALKRFKETLRSQRTADKAGLERETEKRRQVEERLMTAQIEKRIDSQPAVIHRQAEIPAIPAQPDVARCFLLGGAAGGLLGLLLAIPAMFLFERAMPRTPSARN